MDIVMKKVYNASNRNRTHAHKARAPNTHVQSVLQFHLRYYAPPPSLSKRVFQNAYNQNAVSNSMVYILLCNLFNSSM